MMFLESTGQATSVETVVTGVRQMISGILPRPDLISQLSFLTEFYHRPDLPALTAEQIDLTCIACETAVASIIDLYILGISVNTIKTSLEGLCYMLGITDEEVCHGMIENYAPVIEYVLANR